MAEYIIDDDFLDEETMMSAEAQGYLLGLTRCKDCKHFAGEGMYCAENICVQFDHFYCYYAERKEE